MGKVALIMDEPKDCYSCQLCVMIDWPNDIVCVGKDKRAVDYVPDKRPKWCPLKPAPKKLAVENRRFSEEYARGFNACIDKLIGGG